MASLIVRIYLECPETSRDIFEKGYDKNQLMRVCKDNGFPHPLTIDISNAKNLIKIKLLQMLKS